MRFDYPAESHIIQLRSLWKAAFGDTDEFLDIFFSTAYAPDRCRCISEKGQMQAALYWLDCSCRGEKFAYLYAVATAKAARGQGLCRKLMADTADILRSSGYRGAILVPQDEGLFSMYGKMGYLPATCLEEFHCAAAGCCPAPAELTAAEYAAHRRNCLPEGSIRQEGENLTFLAQIARFYRGDRFLAAVSRETEHLRILEYLGDPGEIASLVAALGHREATVRSPGGSKSFSMYLPLVSDCPKPEYFAFCFD